MQISDWGIQTGEILRRHLIKWSMYMHCEDIFVQDISIFNY